MCCHDSLPERYGNESPSTLFFQVIKPLFYNIMRKESDNQIHNETNHNRL